MTIDHTDCEPRPAHDAWAHQRFPNLHPTLPVEVFITIRDELISLNQSRKSANKFCNQLGIDFNKLPHCI